MSANSFSVQIDKSLSILSRLLLVPRDSSISSIAQRNALRSELLEINQKEFHRLISLADSNHVVVRGLEEFLYLVADDDENAPRNVWAKTALQAERARIEIAQKFLYEICDAFELYGQRSAVIKSLDHWPDLGSDLDLFTDSQPDEVIKLLHRVFHAEIAPRSWGDRLAGKWNFLIPGLKEAVEVHIGRLGQTGEQCTIASNLLDRSRCVTIGSHTFRTTSVSDRLMISTLQRMYRHFYFRLCDIVDTSALADACSIDYDHLRACAKSAGIWEGVATYLVIVSDYVRSYRGLGIELPRFVRDTARFGGDQIYFARDFLRVPIMPQSVQLYGSQLAGILSRGELQSGARLSLLPWLATAAVVGQKLTGSDKGIW